MFRVSGASILAALSVGVIYLVRLPLIPSASFLEYDPADIFILLAGLFLGWQYGLGTLVAASAVQALTVSSGSGVYGFVMHVIATGALLTVTCLVREITLRKQLKDLIFLPVCLVLGCIAMTAVMVPANLLITPAFMSEIMGIPRETVDSMIKDLMFTGIIPFNALKSGINSAIACVLFFSLKPVLQKTPFSRFLR
jgi:riboflavin transporter FmnP